MTIIDRIRSLMRIKPADPATDRIVYVPQQRAGVRVNHDNALTISALWAGVKAICDPVSYLSWHVMERSGQSKKRREDMLSDWLLNAQPNPEMSAGNFRATLLSHAILWGNGYAEIERDGAGRPSALWPLPPDRVCPKRDEFGNLYYEVWPQSGPSTPLDPRDVFHVKGLGFDGLVGYSLVKMAARSLGLTMALEENSASFFGNGSRLSGILKHPGKLNPEARDENRKEWMRMHGGPTRAYSVAVIDQGCEFQPLSVSNSDSQMIDSRKLQVVEISRWLRVPPHMLSDADRATWNNIEQYSIEFVTGALMPWINKLEQEANIKLFGPMSQGRLFTKMNIRTLLRGDSAAQANFLTAMLDRGVYNINEAREYLDMDSIGPEGEKRLVPLNMTTLEKAGEEPIVEPEPPAPEPDDDEGEEVPAVTNRLNGHRSLILP